MNEPAPSPNLESACPEGDTGLYLFYRPVSSESTTLTLYCQVTSWLGGEKLDSDGQASEWSSRWLASPQDRQTPYTVMVPAM